MKKIILTVIITLVFIVIAFTAYIYSGTYDVSQLTPHNAITKWMISMPALSPTHTDQKIWAITDFLLNKMNKMSPAEYQAWIKKYSD